MPCTSRSYEAMAEAGWPQEDIDLLKKEIEVARQQAKRDAALAGTTATQQRRLMDIAEQRARAEAHDRWHRKLADFFDSLPKGDAKHMVHVDAGGHPLAASDVENLKKLGFS